MSENNQTGDLSKDDTIITSVSGLEGKMEDTKMPENNQTEDLPKDDSNTSASIAGRLEGKIEDTNMPENNQTEDFPKDDSTTSASIAGRLEGEIEKRTPATQWISVYNARHPMRQRYRYNVADVRLSQHIEKGYKDGLFISCVASCSNLWALIMDAGTNFSAQVYELSPHFLHKDWIMEQWEKNYYISAIAGANNGSSLVVMSKGTQYLQQSYKVSDSFPLKWINKKRREGFYVTAMATAGSKWAIVVSRGAASFDDQVVELDSLYPSEAVHRRWDDGYRITSTAATLDQTALVLSAHRRKSFDESQETLRTSAFPSAHVKEKWGKNLYVACLCYGRTKRDFSDIDPQCDIKTV